MLCSEATATMRRCVAGHCRAPLNPATPERGPGSPAHATRAPGMPSLGGGVLLGGI